MNIFEKLKNHQKRIHKISFLCLGFGCLTVLGGCAMANFDVKNLNTSSEDSFEVKKESYNKQDLKKIELDTYHSNIKVEAIKGDQIQIEYKENEKNPMNIKNTGGNLEFERGNNEIVLSTLFQFQWFSTEDKEIDIILQIPEDYAGDVSIDNTYGTLDMGTFQNLATLEIDDTHGNIDLHDMSVKNLDLSSSYTAASLSNLQSATRMYVEVEHDALTMQDIQANELLTDLKYCEAKIENSKMSDSMVIEANQGSLFMDDITTKDLDINTTYTPIKAGIVESSGNTRIDANQDDVKFDQLKTKQMEVSTKYADLEIVVLDVETINADTTQGGIIAKINGTISDYNISSEVKNGENNLPLKLNPNKEKKLDITTSYGDIDITFIEDN